MVACKGAGHPPLDPSTKLRVSGPTSREGDRPITLTMGGEGQGARAQITSLVRSAALGPEARGAMIGRVTPASR